MPRRAAGKILETLLTASSAPTALQGWRGRQSYLTLFGDKIRIPGKYSKFSAGLRSCQKGRTYVSNPWSVERSYLTHDRRWQHGVTYDLDPIPFHQSWKRGAHEYTWMRPPWIISGAYLPTFHAKSCRFCVRPPLFPSGPMCKSATAYNILE